MTLETTIASSMQPLGEYARGLTCNLKATYFADTGPFARALFPKALEFFAATKRFQNVNVFGSNRSSKSIALAYAASCWLTGEYPDWWPGRVFTKPVRVWVAGETGTLVRNNMQRYMTGEKDREGIGCFIRPEQIHACSYQAKPQGLCERAIIHSAFGGLSVVEFKTYDQGAGRFASDTIDAVLFDEEPPGGVYAEGTVRTGTTRGLVCSAFTAVKGITPLISTIAPEFAGGEAQDPEITGMRNIVIGWADIPESVLPNAERERLKRSFPPNQIIPRTTGVPLVGEGAVWPVPESDFVIPPFEIPDSWPRICAIDPGYQDPTAVLHGAYDMENDAIYLYGEYRKALEHLSVHVGIVHEKGEWIPCVIDPAGANIADGERIYDAYAKALHNPCHKADKVLTDGLMDVYDRMQDSRLFVFSNLRQWLGEFRAYMRDDRGRLPARTQDHHYDLMSATRYLVRGIKHARQRPLQFKRKGDYMRARIGHKPTETDLAAGVF